MLPSRTQRYVSAETLYFDVFANHSSRRTSSKTDSLYHDSSSVTQAVLRLVSSSQNSTHLRHIPLLVTEV